MSDLLTLSQQLRTALERQDETELTRLTAEFQAMVDRLEGDIDALSRDLADPNLTAAELERLESYKRLLRDVEAELAEYQDYLLDELALTAGLWLGLGLANSTLLMQQAAADAGEEVTITPLDESVLAILNDYLEEGSPLYDRLLQYGTVAAERIRALILDAVGRGLNPRELARLIVSEGLGMSLTDALRMARTLQIYAYREATLRNYRNNSDVVKGWVWMSALIPSRTCMACVAMHGTIHTLDEVLNDHHGGLCAMLPYLGTKNPIGTLGEAWFDSLPPSAQREMMGAGKYEAWKAGKFSFADLVTTYDDPVYGEMRTEQTLQRLIEG